MKRQLTILAAAIGLASGAFAATIDLSTVTADKTFNNGDVITGTLGAKVKLSIADNALVTLRNARIDGSNNSLYPWAGLTCLGNAEIRIDGINYVRGFYQQYPGIYVPEGKTLTIRQAVNISGYAALGGGTLEARDNGTAAGIGAGANSACGNIVIESGIITAQGHNSAGIGGGGESCGDITIKGGVVYATGGWDGAGIGGCGSAGCGNITIDDGVTLVVAQAGSHNDPAPIGAGGGGTCGAVTVNLAEGATDTTGVTGSGIPTRTIERPSIVQQYANGVAWKFRLVEGGAEICDEYYFDGEAYYRPAIASSTTGALVIPDTLGGRSVTRIGNEAFRDCNKITSVTIPASVTSIGERAFQRCELLTAVTMPPSGVTDIGERAFESCGSLTSVTIPATATSIGYMAFYGCDGLTSVTIPGGVKRIGDSAFEDCDNLANVTIEDGVGAIGERAFAGCGSLTGVTIPASVKTVEAQAFENCTSLATANISGGTIVEDGAFFNCMALADANRFVIINGVLQQYVGGEADVTVPAGVTRIGAMAFAAHTSKPIFPNVFPPLVSVTLPDSVTSIGAGAFAYCTDLEHVSFPANMPSVEDGAFSLCVKLADADGFVIIGGALHLYIGTATEVTIPAGVTSIGPMSFMSYTGISPQYFGMSPVTSLTIPSGVKGIGVRAFIYCPNLTTVSIPSTMTDIGDAAFYSAMSLYCPLQTVHVEAGDTERIKGLLFAAAHPVDGITFVEDYKPMHPIACYAMLNEGDIAAPFAAPKAVTLTGAVYDGCDVVGIVELKLGKVSAKKKTSKVSGSVTTLDGKKHAAKGVTVTGIDGTAPATVSLGVKGIGTMNITIGGTQFAGALGGAYHVQSADVGGAWAGGSAVASVEPGDLSAFAGRVLADFLPTNEVAAVSGGKWKFTKAASVKWAKPKKGAALPEIYDEASGKGLVVDTAKGTNLSGLKLTYTPKKGTFKGSFNVYALEGSGAATKLKKYKMNVTGVVVDGTGYGVAKCKNPSVNWTLTVE